MYGKAACPVPRGAGDSTGIWKRYCGTIAKAGGNGENKLLPAVTEGSCLLERSNRNTSLFLSTSHDWQDTLAFEGPKDPIILGASILTSFLAVFVFLFHNAPLRMEINNAMRYFLEQFFPIFLPSHVPLLTIKSPTYPLLLWWGLMVGVEDMQGEKPSPVI